MNQGFFHKGNVSNLVSLALLTVGLYYAREAAAEPHAWAEWVLAAGLFGLAGGITNWLAVKMLFDKVPLLYGSGVIPNRFREIRETVRNLIMFHFFDAAYLERFFAGRVNAVSHDPALESKVAELLKSEEADQIITRKLEELQESPSSGLLKMVGTATVKPLVTQFVNSVGVELAPRLAAEMARPDVEIEALREQIDELLATKLEELTPQVVRRMMEDVMREHLGWLIVWGNVFGGLIGLLAHAAGYADGGWPLV